MIKLHFLLSLRSLLKYKISFLINLIGLTTGLACFVLIFLWVSDELNMDKFHTKDNRLFQVMEHQQYAEEIMSTTSTPGLLAETLAEEIPEIEYAATTTWINTNTLSVGDRNIKADGYYVGPDYFNIFSYELVHGQPDQVLQDVSSIVISESLALKLFDDVNTAVGQTVEFQHEDFYVVSGIFKDVPTNSSYQFEYVLPFEDFKKDNPWVTSWGNNGPSTYIILRPDAIASAVSDKISGFVADRNEHSNVTLFLKRYSERYLYGRYEDGELSGGRIEYVRLFSIIALFILIIACINFMNLSTARASRRAKEVGVKKTIGARPQSLVYQFLTEAVFISTMSMSMALLIVWVFLPTFNEITNKEISMAFGMVRIGQCLLIAVLTGWLAGSYPALYLSKFKPVKVLKGDIKGSFGELWVRRGLVVFQFALSVILIVAVITVFKQVQYVQSKNLGFNKENVIRFGIEGAIADKLETFLTQARQIPGVVNASSLAHSFIGRMNNTSGLEWEGKNPEERVLFENVRVNYELIETMGINLVEGRSFSESYGSDTSKIIFNEAALDILGFEDPIGKVIRLWDQYDLEIIGIAENFHFQSLHEQVNPLFMMLDADNTWNIMVRMERGSEQRTLAELESFYHRFNPGFEFDYDFIDDEYARLYSAEMRVATLSKYFAGMAIMISCLGLFGLAAFTAERRQKEIGIRKTLGSSSLNIVFLLSRDFTRLVFASILIALPISYFLVQNWISQFAYKIDLNIWIFIGAGITALMVAWLTISTQAIKAARVNPIECLRDE